MLVGAAPIFKLYTCSNWFNRLRPVLTSHVGKKRYWCIAIDGPLLAVFKTASASSRRAASFNSRASVTSLGVRWGHPQSDPPWTYIRRCEIALKKFDEAIEWSDISPSEIESELEAAGLLESNDESEIHET